MICFISAQRLIIRHTRKRGPPSKPSLRPESEERTGGILGLITRVIFSQEIESAKLFVVTTPLDLPPTLPVAMLVVAQLPLTATLLAPLVMACVGTLLNQSSTLIFKYTS